MIEPNNIPHFVPLLTHYARGYNSTTFLHSTKIVNLMTFLRHAPISVAVVHLFRTQPCIANLKRQGA